MEKTTTLNLRVSPALKKEAEEILSKLGLSMSAAIDIYLKQITLTGGIPFPLVLPDAPKSFNMDKMTTEEIRAKLQQGYNDMTSGNVMDAEEALDRFEREKNIK